MHLGARSWVFGVRKITWIVFIGFHFFFFFGGGGGIYHLSEDLGWDWIWASHLGARSWVLAVQTKTWIVLNCVEFKCSYLSQNCPWLQHGYMCTSRGHVTWLFILGNMCSNHCDVTVRFVTLNSNCTPNQNRQQNSHSQSWETDQN